MAKYVPHKLSDLTKGKFANKRVQVQGIVRGAVIQSAGEDYEAVCGYVDNGDTLTPFRGVLEYRGQRTELSFMRTSSESNLAITMRGEYSSESGLEVHSATLKNIEVKFKTEFPDPWEGRM